LENQVRSYYHLHPKTAKTVLILAVIIVLLSIMAQRNYLLFHSIAEAMFILTATFVYLLALKTHKYSQDNYLLLIGISYLYISVLHFLHLLTYKGMGLFPELAENMPIQLSICWRLMESCTFALAPLVVRREISSFRIHCIYLTVTTVIIVAIVTQNFPACFIEGQGLTPFKIIGEYVAMATLGLALVIMRHRRDDINPFIWRIMIAAIILMIFQSLCYTLYTDVYGLMNFMGHILSIVSTAVIYQGIVVRGLEVPYDLIFSQLLKRQEELKKLSQHKSDFLANMSHEMRTPLTAIIALTDDLLLENRGPLTAEQEESLREIRESGRELSQLIDDLLDLSKIETGRVSLKLSEVDIGSVVCEVERQLRHLALQHQLNIKMVITSEQKVIADREEVKRVARNLIFNAIKFTPEGGTIEVVVYDVQGEPAGTVLRVRDTGIGIPQKDQELIFDSFYQVERGTAKKYPGTGLGLALVKKIVDLHQGWIKLESEEGRGSTFEIFWPRYPHFDEDFD